MGVADNTIELISEFAFQPTLDRLSQAFEAAGMTVFARIDHQKAADLAGTSMSPATVLIYGNPRGGTPIMLQFPRAALDLPLKVLVREEPDGRVIISFHPVIETLRGASVPEALAASLKPGQSILLDAIRSKKLPCR
jgi:uncharacterized protein (DUF302 family)